jgi:hypothetical protein
VPHDPRENRNFLIGKTWPEKVNGFWVRICQAVPISETILVENPIDCRIFFADNAGRKTESGIGGKNP